MRWFSFGGGVQSVACLVLQAQGRVNYDGFIFANVGDDSENPDTLDYLRDVARPFAAKHGVRFEQVAKAQTLYANLVAENRSIKIPMRLSNGAPGNRGCTGEWKIRRIMSWHLKHSGASKANPVIVGIGFSTDEWQRIKDSPDPRQVNEYPLIDLRLSRTDCRKVIADAGLPVPPKSSCWFCPYQRLTAWQRLKRDKPGLFARACALEMRIQEKRRTLCKDAVWLYRPGIRLVDAVGDQPQLIPDSMDEPTDGDCTSGYCFV